MSSYPIHAIDFADDHMRQIAARRKALGVLQQIMPGMMSRALPECDRGTVYDVVGEILDQLIDDCFADARSARAGLKLADQGPLIEGEIRKTMRQLPRVDPNDELDTDELGCAVDFAMMLNRADR